jgi:hypothetical protein
MSWRKGNRLRLVSEKEARGRTHEIYEDIRTTLGLPITPTAFQAFAVEPAFLELAWSTLRSLAHTQQFFALADRLRADAYTRCYSYFTVPDLCARLEALQFSRGAREEITAAVEMLNHGSGIVLLLLSVLLQAFEGPVGQDCDCERPAIRPVYEARPPLVSEDTATPDVERIFEDVRKTLKVPHLTAEMRALARWPEFFADYWQALKKAVESPLYEVCFRGVHETTFALTKEIPVVVELTTEQLSGAGLSEEDIASVLRIADSFVTATVGTMLNVVFAKIGMEHGNKSSSDRAPQQVA